MKFKFKLQKTADFYEHRETAKKMEIAQVKNHLGVLENRAQSLHEENLNSLRKDNEPQSVEIAWIKVRHDRIEANLNTLDQLKKEIEDVQTVLEQKKIELRKLSQKKKALEKVREKKLSEFKLERSRSEQKLLDENYQILRQFKE